MGMTRGDLPITSLTSRPGVRPGTVQVRYRLTVAFNSEESEVTGGRRN